MSQLFFKSTQDLLSKFPDFSNEMILVKGARNYELEKVVQRLEEKIHGTVLEISFESLRHNLHQYRELIDKKTELMVMVKANAYGNGILEVANFLQHEKVKMLGVAYVDEAIVLRQNGIDLPIMIMNPHITSFSQFERFDLQAEIFSNTYLSQLINEVSGDISIHIKLDTGMHRLGFSETELPELIQLLKNNPRIKVESVFTHFSSSDDPSQDDFTHAQAEKFEKMYNDLCETLDIRPIKHACNSSGIVRFRDYHYDMVRLGIGLYGFDPTGSLPLKPVSTLKSVVSQVQHLSKGETIGYSRKGIVHRDSEIAVIPIGYEDGFLRYFGNGKASILINDKLCPTIGNICMDMTMVDVTDLGVTEGDEAVIFGVSPTIEQLATASQTIPYEILTNISNRVKRVFVSE